MRDHLQSGVSSIRKGGTASVDTDGDTADEVAHADRDTRPEEGESGVVAVGRVRVRAFDWVQLGGEHDGHDDAVDGDDLAENDGDKILSADARRLDAAA